MWSLMAVTLAAACAFALHLSSWVVLAPILLSLPLHGRCLIGAGNID